MTTHSRRLSYANVAATLALALSLTGGAYAATQLPKNSVGSQQVKDHSLKAKDFKPGQLPAGTQGPAGPRGAQGAQGEPGASGPSLVVTGHKEDQSIHPFDTACPIFSSQSAPISVDRPTVLWANTQLSYVPLGDALDSSHVGSLSVRVSDAKGLVRAESTHALIPLDGPGEISVAGMPRSYVDGADYVLQPGTTYTVGTQLVMWGDSCTGTSRIASFGLDWIGYPAPS